MSSTLKKLAVGAAASAVSAATAFAVKKVLEKRAAGKEGTAFSETAVELDPRIARMPRKARKKAKAAAKRAAALAG